MSAQTDEAAVLATLDRDRRAALRTPRDCYSDADYFRSLQARVAVAYLIETATAALHYMRLHKYADQVWADDLASALASVMGHEK